MLAKHIFQHKNITQEFNSSMPKYYLVFFLLPKKLRSTNDDTQNSWEKIKAHEEKVVTKHIKIYFMKLYEAIWESF